MQVVGVDGCKKGWIAVATKNGRFSEARLFSDFGTLVKHFADAKVIAVDMPIGLPSANSRPADDEAKKKLEKHTASVFLTPPRKVLEQPTYKEARRVAESEFNQGVSAQAYALRKKIFEIDSITAEDHRIFEVHPEVSFRAMAKRSLKWKKKTWNGLLERRALLRRAGVKLPDNLGEDGSKVGPDDVVDAAAAAWSAFRIARREAESLPEGLNPLRQRSPAIWY